MKLLYPTIMVMLGVKFGAIQSKLMLEDGEFSYTIAVIIGCVIYSTLRLSDWAVELALYLTSLTRDWWINRKSSNL